MDYVTVFDAASQPLRGWTDAGRVEHLQTTRTRGGHRESLEVAGVPFEYSDTDLPGAFRAPTSSGSPMEEGLQVRICERAGHILRLEIERP